MAHAKRALSGIRILTTDPEERIGLYAIRYLGRAGAHVDCIARDNGPDNPLGFLSRYVRRKIYLPKSLFVDAFRQFLLRRSTEYDVIIPIDVSTMLVVQDFSSTEPIRCSYLIPKKDSLILADNKELLTQHAQKEGLKCPRTYVRVAPDDIDDLSRSGLTFPCIIKFRGDNRESHWKPDERYRIVRTHKELSVSYKEMHAIEPYPIIQEYIYGKGYGYFALYDKKHKLKAQFCHKRIREYPIAGGPSSCCESYYDDELIRVGRRLLESLEWTGLAMVEFKYDQWRKNLYIIEVNPRYWGSLPLAVLSGVNFPVLHALSALEEDYSPVLQYRLGKRVRFLNKDIRSIITNIQIETNQRKRLKLFLDLFDFRIQDGLISLDDMRPVLHSMIKPIFGF